MTLRNFELDKLVRLGTVLDIVEYLSRGDNGYHTVDFGEAGYHEIDCDGGAGINMEDLTAELLKEAN